jgi:hypothetical protein
VRNRLGRIEVGESEDAEGSSSDSVAEVHPYFLFFDFGTYI